MQKYQNDFQVSSAKPFDKFDWAFNAENTDAKIIKEQQDVLAMGEEASPEQRGVAEYVLNRDAIRAGLRTQYKVGKISEAVQTGNETAELIGWLDLLNLSRPDESLDESLQIHCGGRNAKEALQYFRDNYKPFIEDGDTELKSFEKLDDAEKRKFISKMHEEERVEWSEEDAGGQYAANRYLGGMAQTRRVRNVRDMSDDEYATWSAEYAGSTKYRKFWGAMLEGDNKFARMALSLSMTQSDEARKAYIPALQELSEDDRWRVYRMAYNFNPEVNMWNLVKDELIDSWSKDIPQFFKNGYKWLETDAVDLKQYIDREGGIDAIMSDEKKKDAFRSKFFVPEGGAFLGFNRFVLPSANNVQQGDKNLRDYGKRIYDMGAGMLETRKRFEEIQTATATKYESQGYVMDGIINGVSVGVQFGQFIAFTSLTGGAGAFVRGAATTAKVASKAQKLSASADILSNAAYYGSNMTKAVMPYFAAVMSVDAQDAAQKAGFDDEQSFMFGIGVGVTNSFLEKIQFSISQKNPFLGEKIIELMGKKTEYMKAVMLEHLKQGVIRRGKVFGEEFLVENLQNVVQEMGMYLSAGLSDVEYKEFGEVAQTLFEQSKDLIIPIFTASNIGAGTGFGRAAKTFATAEKIGSDEKAMHDFNAALQTEEAFKKLRESDAPELTPEVALQYMNAMTDDERGAILSRVAPSFKERGKVRKALESASEDFAKAGESLVAAAKAEISKSDAQISESVSIDEQIQTVKMLPAPEADHASNRAYIQDFIKAYGLESDAVYLESMEDAAPEVIESARKDLRAQGKDAQYIEEFLFGNGGAEGFTHQGKVYIVGNKAITPQRTLEILKHETGHKGADGIRKTKEFQTFLGNLLNSRGGAEILREALRQTKGDAYDKLGDMELAEEYMCILAEKVAAKNELTEEERGAWDKVYDFFLELLSGIPKDKARGDAYVANIIRSIWERKFMEDAEDPFAAESSIEESSVEEADTSWTANRERAKKSFIGKIQSRKIESKKLSPEEKALAEEKLEIRKHLDSIPDEDVSNKLEAMESVDADLLSDSDLEYAAMNGAPWAGEPLTKRIERENNASNEGGVLEAMADGGLKLPTPKAIKEDSAKKGLPLSGYLFGEINDLYNSLSFAQQQKYFSKNYADIDETANILREEHGLNFEGSADFLDAFANALFKKANTRFSVADKKITAEIDTIRAQYEGTPQWMKAPNGQPTKLTERQWLQVRTPSFRKWFGDWEKAPENASKIVDKNGEPKVVYHGTSADEEFWTFKKDGSSSQGSYLRGEDVFFFAGEDVAELYSKHLPLMPVFLNIRNPKTVDVQSEIDDILWEYDGSMEEAIEAGHPLERWEGKGEESFEANDSATAYFDDHARELFEDAKKYANDGIIVEGADGSYTSVAFSPTQIKSATDNVGTFDAGNPDIRFSVKGVSEGAKKDPKYKQFLKNAGKGQKLVSIKRFLPAWGKARKAVMGKTPEDTVKKLAAWLRSQKYAQGLDAFDGKTKINFLNEENKSYGSSFTDGLERRVWHAVSDLDKKTGQRVFREDRALMFVNIFDTVFKGQLRVEDEGVEIGFVRKYENGKVHKVMVTPDGAIGDTYVFTSQYPLWDSSNEDSIVKEVSPFLKKQTLAEYARVYPEEQRGLQDSSTPPHESNAPASDNSFGNKGKSENSSESQGQNLFSVADTNLDKRRRLASIALAKKIYEEAGNNFNPATGEADGIKITQEQREWAYMQDMGFLDEDVEWIVNRAEAIAYRMAKGNAGKQFSGSEIERIAISEERSFQRSKIIDAVVRHALKQQMEALRIKQRIEKLEASTDGFFTDEMLAQGVEIDSVIFNALEDGFVPENIDAEISKAANMVDVWAEENGVDQKSAEYIARLTKTLANGLRAAAEELPYGRERESAMKHIDALLEMRQRPAIEKRAAELGRKLAEYYAKNVEALSKEEEAAFAKEMAAAEKLAKEKLKTEEVKQKMRELKAEHRRKRLLAEVERRLSKFNKKPDRVHSTQLKVPALAKWFLAAGKGFIDMLPDEVSLKMEELGNRSFDFANDAAYNRLEMMALSQFGGLRYAEAARLAETLQFIKDFLADKKQAQLQKILDFQAEALEASEGLAAGLNNRPRTKGAAGSIIAQSAKEGSSVLRHTLENLFLVKGKEGAQQDATAAMVNAFATEISRASIKERDFTSADDIWLHETGVKLYGSESRLSHELLEPRKEYEKYSLHGEPLAKANIIAIVAMLEQGNLQQAYRIMRAEQYSSETDKPKISESIGRDLWRRFGLLKDMKAELSETDLAMLEEVKGRFRGRFPAISNAAANYSGAPLRSEDVSYFPVIRKGELTAKRPNGSVSKIPGYFTPRVISFKDIDETADIFSVFRKRSAEDAHFLAFGDLPLRMDAITKAKPMQDALRERLTKIQGEELLNFIDQSINGKLNFATSAEAKIVGGLATTMAFSGLGWNPISAVKQLTGAAAFGLEVGAFQNVKDIMWTVGTPEGRRAFVELFNSDSMRARRGGGINPGLEHAMREFSEGKYGNGFSAFKRFIAKTRPFAMTAGMDSIASSLGGAGIYMRFLEKHSLMHDLDKARELAMLDTMEIVERTQQSSLTLNQSSFLRNHGFLGRAIMQFKSNPQLFWSYEMNALRAWKSDMGNGSKFRRLVNILALNHFIMPAIFNGLGAALSILMGDDWDEEDLTLFAVSTFTDVLSGWWLGGILKGIGGVAAGINGRDLTSEVLPAASLARIGSQFGLILRDFTRGEFSENFEKRFKNLGKSVFAPARYAIKIYDNATDNEEGVLW